MHQGWLHPRLLSPELCHSWYYPHQQKLLPFKLLPFFPLGLVLKSVFIVCIWLVKAKSSRTLWGFPDGSVVNNLPTMQETACQCRRHEFDPRVRKISWRSAWQPTLVFLPGESHGHRSLVGYTPWGRKESDTTEHASTVHCIQCFAKPRLFSYGL